MGVGWVALLVGAHINCRHSHTGIDITDTGLKDFSAALGSSTTITKVELCGKYKCPVCLPKRVFLCVRLGVRPVGGCDGV